MTLNHRIFPFLFCSVLSNVYTLVPKGNIIFHGTFQTTLCTTLKLLWKWRMTHLVLIEHHCLYLHTHFVTTIIHHQIIMTSVKSKSWWQVSFKIYVCCNEYGNKCSITLTDVRQFCLLHWLSASLHEQASTRALSRRRHTESPSQLENAPKHVHSGRIVIITETSSSEKWYIKRRQNQTKSILITFYVKKHLQLYLLLELQGLFSCLIFIL